MMIEQAVSFFNSRSTPEQVAMLIGGGIALHWMGVQVGAIVATLMKTGS